MNNDEKFANMHLDNRNSSRTPMSVNSNRRGGFVDSTVLKGQRNNEESSTPRNRSRISLFKQSTSGRAPDTFVPSSSPRVLPPMQPLSLDRTQSDPRTSRLSPNNTQDMRSNIRLLRRSNKESDFLPKLDLSRSSESWRSNSNGCRGTDDTTIANRHPGDVSGISDISGDDSPTDGRSYLQSPRSSFQSPSPSPRYSTPLDKSVIWNLNSTCPLTGKLAYVNEQLQRHGLHTVPDYAGGRILIDGKTRERDSGYTQFVGSILSVDDRTGISMLSTMPPVVTVNSRILPSVEKHWDDLELLQAEDGATLGLYWFNDRWVIRTAGSFDANKITWDGRVTFGQMVADIMKKYPQFRYDLLDRNKCYTFGIKHPAIHSYHEGLDHPVIRAWFIQSADIARVNAQSGIFNGSIQFDESIGIPLQRPLTLAAFKSFESVSLGMHAQYKVNNEHSGVPDARTHIGNTKLHHTGITLENVLEHTRGALSAVIAASPDVTPVSNFFGIIMRSKKYTFFIPSDLYQYIAATCYTNELNDMLGSEHFNRDKFIVLFNALCPLREREIFIRIYPQYAKTIAKIREYLCNGFISAMYAVYNKIHHNVQIDNIYGESTLDLARSLFIVWSRQFGVPKSTERSRIIELFSDYVLEKHNTRILYDEVYSNIAPDI